MKNIYVYSADNFPDERGSKEIAQCGDFFGPAGLGDTIDIPCVAGFQAQYLVIKRREFGTLILCEVRVYAF